MIRSNVAVRHLFSSRIGWRSQSTLCQAYKKVMTGVSQPAMVITTTRFDPAQQRHEPRGLTASSVTSLSVTPRPLVSFNVQVPSRTSQVLRAGKSFAVNILAPSAESVRLCRAFAGLMGKTLNPFEAFPGDFAEGLHSIPVISHATAVLYCEAVEIFPVQDHEIWVAAVCDVAGADSERQGSLFYQNHHFHSLGPAIDETIAQDVQVEAERG